MRQQILILCLATPDLGSPVLAWSFYDGTGRAPGMSGDSDTPPFASVLPALVTFGRLIEATAKTRAGHLARGLQTLLPRTAGHEHETSHLRFEYVLERMVQA